MAVNSDITIDEAITTLSVADKEIVRELYENAVAIGYMPVIGRAGKTEGNYKLEFKKDKNSYVLFILRISKGQLSIGSKLLHMGKYCDLIDNLSDTVRNELLESRVCNVDGGCTAFINFKYNNKKYYICRHAIRLKKVTPSDTSALWKMLEAEVACRESA